MDDDDTVTVQPPQRIDVGVLVECVRDVSSNVDAGVPDSLWRVASALGMDSLYAIDFRLQYPPYQSGDFDGDGVAVALTIPDRPSATLRGDALWLAHRDSTSGFLVWDGAGAFPWDSRRR